MIEPIDFLCDPQNQDNYLLNPRIVNDQIITILDNCSKEWSPELHVHFALLNRMLWAISILDSIDNYNSFTDNDITTFFLAFSVFNEITEVFEKDGPGATIFVKTLREEAFGNNIVKRRDDRSFIRFIRSLSIAHTTNTNRGGKFLKEGHAFILLSIDTYNATPTCSEIKNSTPAFYFHAIDLEGEKSHPIIFKLYIDELKEYLKARYSNCDFSNLGTTQSSKIQY